MYSDIMLDTNDIGGISYYDMIGLSLFYYIVLIGSMYMVYNNINNKEEDIFKLIIKNGGLCYLTGDFTYGITNNYNFNEKNFDVVIKKMTMDTFVDLLIDNEIEFKQYDFDLENKNYKRCCVSFDNKGITNFIEFTIINDNYFTFNSTEIYVNSLDDLEYNEIEKYFIWIKMEKVEKKLYLNKNKKFDNIYTILRGFYYASKYDLVIDDIYIELIKLSMLYINKKFEYDIVFKIMSKINFNKIHYLKQFNECKLFEFIGFEFEDKETIINRCEFLNDNFLVYFISNLTDNSFKNIKLDLPNIYKQMIDFSRFYNKEKKDIKNKIDLLCVLTKYNKKYNYDVYHYEKLYYSNIEFIELIYNYPISIHKIKFDISKVEDVKFTKYEILILIHNNKLEFTQDKIDDYIEKNEIIKVIKV